MPRLPLFDAAGRSSLLGRIVRAYFSDPERRLHIFKGERLLTQGAQNDKLYYVLEGSLTCTIRDEDEIGDEVQVEAFRAEKDSFVGVYSFFSGNPPSRIRATALEDTLVAWIDRDVAPVDAIQHGPLREQFFPVVLDELNKRQYSLIRMAQDQAAALNRLHLAEKMSTLGGLAAGLAHEINNAVGVMARSEDYLRQMLSRLLHERDPELAYWFDTGVERGQSVGSADVRRRAREFMTRFPDLEYDKAKALARIFGDTPLPAVPSWLDEGLSMWETGRACHDMRLAAEHAASLVRSIKQLGGRGNDRKDINIADSILEALALVKSDLRRHSVTVDPDLPDDLPLIFADKAELVQVWVNIIKNGCEAMADAGIAAPRIRVSAHLHRRAVQVDLVNNGPRISPELLHRLFLPNITTKRGASEEMGLGLGLYIAKSTVDRYNGELTVHSNDEETCFSVLLPLNQEHLEPEDDFFLL